MKEEILTSVFSVLGKLSGGVSWESAGEKKPGGDFKDARKNSLLPEAILQGDTHTHMLTLTLTHTHMYTCMKSMLKSCVAKTGCCQPANV